MGTAARREPLKQRVNRCLLKLADRDTEAMAAAELEAIARSLGPDELPAFVSAVSDARPTDKTPLRRHALRALALVAASHPRDAVAPLVPRILAAALRRVRDQDSSVRAALIDTTRAAAAASSSTSDALLVAAGPVRAVGGRARHGRRLRGVSYHRWEMNLMSGVHLPVRRCVGPDVREGERGAGQG